MSFLPDDLLLWVGQVVKTQGMKGQVRVSGAGERAAFYEGNKVYLDNQRGLRKALTVESLRIQRKVLILRFQEVKNIAEAEELVGSRVYVTKESLAPLPPGEFYWYQLLGMEVTTEGGRGLGRLEEIFPTGSNDVFVVRKDGKEILIPATDEVVAEVDLKRKIMRIHLVEGLLSDVDL